MTTTLPNTETLAIRLDGPFAHVTLNRPDVKNAMNSQMVLEITAVFEALRNNREIRAVVLAGAGGTFCAGGDIKEMAAAFQNGSLNQNSGALDTMLRTVNQAPQVVIARVEGAAMGGGFGLVCVSDIAIASTEARMGLPEVRLGLVPALISPYVIQRLGLTRARELMLTGRRFGGEEAQRCGLVHSVCLPSELDAQIQTLLNDMRQCSPNALAACKRLMFTVIDQDLDATVEFRANLLTELRQSEEGQEGMIAFVQKRAPRWAAES
ncbi:MAG: enoyl-CoA hydratase/isomerase family protein [Anaerolineae bacterium]|nr:enoyl-CoA hydratase/isomerase family protein [Anaerolineae bacterium]